MAKPMETHEQKELKKLSRDHDDPKESPRIRREHEVYRQDNRPIITTFSPVIQTFITDWFHMPFDMQHDKICGKIEKNFYKCLQAYGSNLGFTQCRDYIDDYRECTSFDKQKQRLDAMRIERDRQMKSGERQAYSKPPRMGSYENTEY